jgi:hypothetical protein
MMNLTHIDGSKESRPVPVRQYPRVLVMFTLQPPGIFTDRSQTNEFVAEPWITVHKDDTAKFFASSWELATYGNLDFCRMLAKIGHAYMVAELGFVKLAGWQLLLPELILGVDPLACSHLVGCAPTHPVKQELLMHELQTLSHTRRGKEYLLVQIRLFGHFGAPSYHVVVAERSLPLAAATSARSSRTDST